MNKKEGISYIGFVMLLVFALLVSACAQVKTYLPQAATQAPSTASTPAIPQTGSLQVVANDQTYDGTNVVIAKVISKGPGWMAIHAQLDGHIGPVIGYTHLNDGENDNVTVKIDPKQATPVMYAMLHVDAGKVGVYEFPGPDVPAMQNGAMVSPAFKATVGQTGPTPSVTVRDQNVASGKVFVDQVVSKGPGWIAIHVQNPDGSPGEEIGYAAVKDGVNNGVFVTIDPSKATPVLIAMLHADAGQIGMYEYPGPDSPVLVNGQMVGPTFKSGPTMAMVTTGTPAAATAAPTTAPAAATVASSPTASMNMATMAPNGPQPVVKVSDQQIQNGMVKVDDVVSNGPGWIVIYTMNNNQVGTPIGHTQVQNGDNKNVMVQIDASKATDILYAQLHVDAGKIGVFEYPGPDSPLMIGVQMIAGQFKNLSSMANMPMPTLAPSTPGITVQDQAIHNGAVVIPQVVAVGDTWLVIHPRNPDGSMGDYIGYALVHDGVTKNVVIRLDLTRTSRVLFAMLHTDVAKKNAPNFPGADAPVMVNGSIILPSFHVVGPLTGDVSLSVGKDSNGSPLLADGLGMTLYMNLNDTPGVSNCTGNCLANFKPLEASGAINTQGGVSISKVGVIVRPDGIRQVTYAGSPLYYFNGDQNPGDTKGQGLNGVWFLITP